MPLSLPPKFVDINTARSAQGFVNVVGIVVDCLEKARSHGTSIVSTFTIKDCDLEGQSWDGLKIKYFNDNELLVPDVKVHDVILLRNIRIRPHQGRLLAVAAGWDRVPWAIFRHSEKSGPSASLICSPKSAEPTQQERAYANSLLNLVVQTGLTEEQPRRQTRDNRSTVIPTVPPKKTAIVKKRDRFSLIKDASPDTYVDLVAQVVKTFPEQDKFLLYVTDYTVNKALFDYAKQSDEGAQDRPGDRFGYIRRSKRPWQGPFGRMTLQVTLWDPHASFAQQNLKEDDYVHLRNVHMKLSPTNGMLEGKLHTDKIYTEKICVHTIGDDDDSPHVIELKKRKREYWKRNQLDKAQIAEDFGNLDDGPQDRASKKNAKKRKKEQQQKKQPTRMEEGQTEITAAINTKRYEPNKNIRAKNPSIPCRSVTDILTNETHNNSLPGAVEYRLPFQNVAYRTTVRVVDFFPPRLEDFAVSYNPEYKVLSDVENDSQDDDDDDEDIVMNGTGSQRRRRSWEWRFCLLVEDAKPATPGQPRDRMKLFVWGHEAEHLLRLDAVDLRKNADTLNELRERLFILWGDLEERKRASPDGRICPDMQGAPSSTPFTCCVREYGVKCRCSGARHEPDEDAMMEDDEGGHESGCLGWERRFALHGTTIM